MGEYSELFVAFDVAKKKHAVAIAEGGRRGEVRFVGEIENSPATIERMINIAPQRNQQLPRHGYYGDPPSAPGHGSDALTEPFSEIAARLVAKPEPGKLAAVSCQRRREDASACRGKNASRGQPS